MDLNGKVAFISGGAGGIGGGLADAFAEKGARLILADMDREGAIEQAARFGDRAIGLGLDVTSPESWRTAAIRATAHFGAIDLLCNNAGVSIGWNPLVDVPPDQFDLAMKVNVYGVYHGVQAFAPAMIARGCGHIVNVASFNGLIAMPVMGPYSASKFAVTALSVSMRGELAPHGIGVTAVYPGATRSGMSAAIGDKHRDSMKTMVLMEPIHVGRAVATAVEQNLPHVISHPNLKPAFDAWMQELDAAFGEPADPDYRP